MSKSNVTENDLMKLIFQKVLPSYLGTLNTTGNTDFYLALHTTDPGETGNQSTNEVSYTDYARVAIVRSAVGWTVTDNQAINAALIQFPLAGVGSNANAAYVSIGTLASGAGQILYSGQLNDARQILSGNQPQFAPNDIIFEED